MASTETTTEDVSQTIYLALGIPQGIVWVDGPGEETLGNIRCGGRTVQFPLDAFRYWIRALDGVDVSTLRAVAAKQHDLDDFADNLAFMVESKLLLPWSSTTQDIELFQDLRIIPTGIGMGNSPEEPHKFVICSRNDGQPLLRIDFVSYAIWSFCDGVSSLEQACQSTAKHLQVTLESVHELALTLIPALMRSGIALLDVIGEPLMTSPISEAQARAALLREKSEASNPDCFDAERRAHGWVFGWREDRGNTPIGTHAWAVADNGRVQMLNPRDNVDEAITSLIKE